MRERKRKRERERKKEIERIPSAKKRRKKNPFCPTDSRPITFSKRLTTLIIKELENDFYRGLKSRCCPISRHQLWGEAVVVCAVMSGPFTPAG